MQTPISNVAGGEDFRLPFPQLPWDALPSSRPGLWRASALKPLAGQVLAATELTFKLPPLAVALVALHRRFQRSHL